MKITLHIHTLTSSHTASERQEHKSTGNFIQTLSWASREFLIYEWWHKWNCPFCLRQPGRQRSWIWKFFDFLSIRPWDFYPQLHWEQLQMPFGWGGPATRSSKCSWTEMVCSLHVHHQFLGWLWKLSSAREGFWGAVLLTSTTDLPKRKQENRNFPHFH